MTELLIVYHSRTGGTEQMAHAALSGAQSEGEARVLRARDARSDDMLKAAGYIFACPENLASVSGEMKEFFDQTYYPLLGKIEGRAYAQMVCAGSDGTNAVRQIARIATGWRLKEVQKPLIICTHAQSEQGILAPKTISGADRGICINLGASMSAGLQMGVF